MALTWGAELADGRTPDFTAPQMPTKHPFNIAVGIVLSPLGPQGAMNAYSALSILALALLGYAVFRLVSNFGAWGVGAVAVLLVITRPHIGSYTSHTVIDLPFVALVVLAISLLVEAPRRNWGRVLALLLVAGLMRPEAWALAALYAAWFAIAGARTPVERSAAVGLALGAPAMWIGFDWIVTGEPLQSFTKAHRGARSSLVAAGYPEKGASSFGWVPAHDFLVPAPRALRSVIGIPLMVAGFVMILLAPGAARRLRSTARGEKLERTLVAERTLVVAASVVLGSIVVFVALRRLGFPSNERYMLTGAILLLCLAAASLSQVGRSRAALVAAVIGVSGVLVTLPGDLRELANTLADQHRQREDERALVQLASLPVVKDAISRCPRLLVGGPGVAEVSTAVAIVADIVDRDPASIPLRRRPSVAADGSVFVRYRRATPIGSPAATRGIWSFASQCAR